MRWYYYLHTNGDIIGKNPAVVDSDASYFDGPFVKKVWCINTEERKDAWNLVIESLASGARLSRVTELVDKWGLTLEDLPNYLVTVKKPSTLQQDGMHKFLKEILHVNPDEFWELLRGGPDCLKNLTMNQVE